MNWKIALDKYLTTEPDNGFQDWAEYVTDKLSDNFYNIHSDWVDNSDQYNDWLNKLFDKEYPPSKAAAIIERARTIWWQNNY